MSSFRGLTRSVWAELPDETLARWAALAFSFSVLTLELSLAASQLFLAFAFLAYLIHLLHDRPSVRFLPVRVPLVVFCLLTMAAVLGSRSPAVGWLAARKLVLFCIWLLAANLITQTRHLMLLLQGLFLESALVGIVGAGQFLAQYHSVRAEHPDRIYFYMTAERIHGFMGHWMNFGGQQMLVFALMLGWLLLGKDRENVSGDAATGRTKKLWWVGLAIVVISIGLNMTRGVWLGCFAAGIYLIARWKARWLWLAAALPLAALLVAPGLIRQRVAILLHPTQDPALSIRFEMWQAGLRMMKKHPWLGVGPNIVPMVYPLYLPTGKAPEIGYHDHLHNNLLQLGAERGLPCLAVWAWLMLALGLSFWRFRGRPACAGRLGRMAWVADASLASWLAFLIEGGFEYNFGASPVLMVFLFVTAMPFVRALNSE